MTFERSFMNFVQILSEEEITPEISPSALADIGKEYSLRAVVAIVSDAKEPEKTGEADGVIPLFGSAPENEPPAYVV